MKYLVLFICVFACLESYAKNNVGYTIQSISDDCEYGKTINIYDVDQDGKYDTFYRILCDNSKTKYNVLESYDINLQTGYFARIVSGDFESKEYIIELFNPNTQEKICQIKVYQNTAEIKIAEPDSIENGKFTYSRNDLIVYPNPFKNNFSIEFLEEMEEGSYLVKLIDQNGVTFFSEYYHVFYKGQKININIPSIIEGAYILHIQGLNINKSFKIVCIK